MNFGYSKADYEALTPKEKAFILKAWEDKKILDMSLTYKAVFTAFYNCNRKKGKKALKLITPKAKKAYKELVQEQIATIMEIDKKEGKDWVKRIHKANGIK